MKYDVASKRVSVLFDGLCFGNGVALSPKEDFVLFNDIGRFRIWKQYLRGPKAGQTEVFVDLPGLDTNSIVFYMLFLSNRKYSLGRQTNDPCSGKILFSFIPSDDSLVSVSDSLEGLF